MERVERITGDIRDANAVRHAMGDVASVYHLACLNPRESLHSPRESHQVNATRTLTVLEAGGARFVNVSTSEVYGTARTAPMREDHAMFPATAYGASKLAGEAYARAFHLSYGLPVAIVRPFNAYGPRCHHEGTSGEVIPKFLPRARAGAGQTAFSAVARLRTWIEALLAEKVSVPGFLAFAPGPRAVW